MSDGALLAGLILTMTLLGAIAGFFLKRASGSGTPLELLGSPWLWAGGATYGAAAVLNILALRLFDYTVVLPLTALTYVWTLGVARLFLGERVTGRKIAGVGLILLGAVCITLW